MYANLVKSVRQRNAGPWSPQEDVILLRAVHTHSTKWADIVQLQLLPGRSARQLKERFVTTLNPAVDHSPLNAEVRV
jgi:hypothetical protein